MHLSVILPTLDRVGTATLLAERIRELLPALDIEVIIISPVAEALPTSTEMVRYVADSGRGVYVAYNAGLQLARGEYVWFIGDDDYPLDGAKSIGKFLQDGFVDVLIAPVVFSSGRIYRPTRVLLLLHFLNWCQQGIIYRRSALPRHRFFRRLKVQADQYVNILLRSNPKLIKTFLAQPICVFGVGGLSGRLRDTGYASLRFALAQRTLGRVSFIMFRLLTLAEPIVKRLVKIR